VLTPSAPRSHPARARRLLTGNARILELGVTRTGPCRRSAGEPSAHDISRAPLRTALRPGRERGRPVDAACRHAPRPGSTPAPADCGRCPA
jgi:hypothetical protein